jgi:hypothetical protein
MAGVFRNAPGGARMGVVCGKAISKDLKLIQTSTDVFARAVFA